jgi:gamma-glutamyl:cysteine ligase YbdK (ATP-grasp superfamily)
MASLKDTVNLTSQLTELTNQLHGELTEGDVDFERMIEIADQISEQADNLAAAFTRVNEALAEPLQRDGSGSSGNGSRSSASRRRRTSASGSPSSSGSGSSE